MTDLASLVTERRAELGISLREAADRSGGLVSKSQIAAIERGETTTVTDKTVRGLALALDVPVPRVWAAAGVRPSRLRPFEVPERANRLNARERRLVLTLIDTLLAAHEERP